MPLSGSNFWTAFMSPTLPSWIRSRTFFIQRRWKSMAILTTSRRLEVMRMKAACSSFSSR